MNQPEIVYVSYIATTPEALWSALTETAFTKQYWFGRRVESAWQTGSPITFWNDDGHGLDITGEILESSPPRRLSYTWRLEYSAELRREGFSRVTFDLEPRGKLVRLTVTHDQLGTNDQINVGLRKGWPAIVSSLKSLLETGEALVISPAECQA
jgi:uncharacterized protein YndB with AHSA1/START domain